ncbi:MAG: hypothetical protein D6696_06165, partial [Acidobacteria bacterium]
MSPLPAAMRILFATPAPPWPARRGYQLRAAGLIAALAERHPVSVVAQRWPSQAAAVPPPGIDYDEVAISSRAAAAALVAGGWRRPLQVALHRQGAFHRAVARRAESWRAEVVVVVLSRLGDVLPAVAGRPVVVDLIDDLALNMRRRAERQPWLAPLWRWEAWRMRRWDRRLVARARRAVLVCERDRRSLVGDRPELAGRSRVVPLA